MGRGLTWFDAGTHNSLIEASNFVRTLTQRQGLQVGSPDEVAYGLGLINQEKLRENALKYNKSEYGAYLIKFLENI